MTEKELQVILFHIRKGLGSLSLASCNCDSDLFDFTFICHTFPFEILK